LALRANLPAPEAHGLNKRQLRAIVKDGSEGSFELENRSRSPPEGWLRIDQPVKDAAVANVNRQAHIGARGGTWDVKPARAERIRLGL
jgi:hypothetical protein